MFVIVAIVALMIFFNAFYVAAEFATVSARKTRISQWAGSGNRLARLLEPIVNDPKALDTYIAACQVGITLSSLVLGAYGQNWIAVALAPLLVTLGDLAAPAALSISVTTVLIILTTLQVVLGELLPKSVAIQYPEKLALAVIFPMKWSLALFRPLIWLLNGSSDLILKLIGFEAGQEHTHLHSPEEIELLVAESYEGGVLDDTEQQMLRNALRLRQLVARQVMVPRTRLVAAPLESTVDELVQLANETGVTRLPLYQSTIDNMEGFVHLKDLFSLRLRGQQSLAEAVRELLFLPEAMPIADIWLKLKSSHQYMAIVLDEYGGTAGLITVEDLIEEIFGEFQDEFDDEVPLTFADKQGRLHLRGDLLVTDVNEYLDLALPEDTADTLGGLVFSSLGQLPAVGDEVKLGTPGTVVRVEAMKRHRISEVSILMPTDTVPRISEWGLGSG